MSITGEGQVINTVKSSWEILDSPVPLNSKYLVYPTEQKSYSLPPILNTSTCLISERSHHSGEQRSISLPPASGNFTSLEKQVTQESEDQFDEISTDGSDARSRHNTVLKHIENNGNLSLNSDIFNAERMKTSSPASVYTTQNTQEEASRAASGRGTATYVCSQRRRPTEDIAETIATEFEQRVRLSQRLAKKEAKHEEAAHNPHLNSQVITEETENADSYKVYHEESQLSEVSEANIVLQTDSRDTNADTTNSRETSGISRLPSTEGHTPTIQQGNISQISQSSHYSEYSNMSQPYIDSHRYGHGDRGMNDRGRYRHPPPQQVRHMETHNRNGRNGRAHPTNEDQYPRQHSNDSNSSRNQPSVTHSPERQQDNVSMRAESDEQPDLTSRDGDQISQNTGRSRPDGVDHPQIPASAGPVESLPGQALSLPTVPPPTFHPPPTIIQNGISQADLLELMSKGLGKFTTEMAVMVIDKLKPEYETFAKQVGAEVKDSTVTELKELREKLTASEKEAETLTQERDSLKVENSKERDQMKKEFEKDRLKRVKEFEDKKELIDNLQKENEQFKGLLKEKDKTLRKAEMKAKSEEQKRIKSEEEAEKKLKDMQKELDKTKGELLVQKSKKRIQISSAQSKKECLGKLNSQYGLASKQFNGHKPIPYDEGDD